MTVLTQKDLGVIAVVVEEFEKHKLPVLLDLRRKVDNGETLLDVEYDYLSRSIDEISHHLPLTYGRPELQEFCTHVIHLYTEICELAIEVEHKNGNR